MSYLDTAEVRLYFEDHPARSPRPQSPFDAIVLIHGWCCDASDWTVLTGPLTAHARVVAVDLRGCGRSGTSTTGYGVTRSATDLVALLTHLSVARAVLVAHSAGAEIAVDLAVAHPELVYAIVAVDPAYGIAPTERSRIEKVAEELAGSAPTLVVADYFTRLDSPSTAPDVRSRHRRSALACRPDVARRMFTDTNLGPASWHFRPETDAFLRQLRAPLLAIYRNDERGVVGQLFRTRPNDVVIVYSGSGHWPHQEHPQRFVRDVSEWLNRLGAPAGPIPTEPVMSKVAASVAPSPHETHAMFDVTKPTHDFNQRDRGQT